MPGNTVSKQFKPVPAILRIKSSRMLLTVGHGVHLRAGTRCAPRLIAHTKRVTLEVLPPCHSFHNSVFYITQSSMILVAQTTFLSLSSFVMIP